jgi:hypothetical protein
VTGSRVAATAYQNTTGKGLMVSIVSTTGFGTYTLETSPDNVTWSQWSQFRADGGVNNPVFTSTVVVPPGFYYRHTGSFNRWTELRA